MNSDSYLSSSFHNENGDAAARKVESSYELSDSFDSDWQLGWE